MNRTLNLVDINSSLSLSIFNIKLREESSYCLPENAFDKSILNSAMLANRYYAGCAEDLSTLPSPVGFGPEVKHITQQNVTEENRMVVVEWLYQLIDDPPIFCLTVHLLDHLLSRIPVRKGTHFQLLASTCYMITCKYHDVSIPDLDFIVRSTDNSISAQSVLDEERRVLQELDYCLPLLTTRTYFLAFLLQCLNSNEREQDMAQYMLDLVTTYSYSSGSLRMSLVTCAILHYVRQLVPPAVMWSNNSATAVTPSHSPSGSYGNSYSDSDSDSDISMQGHVQSRHGSTSTSTIWPEHMVRITGLREEDLVSAVYLVREVHYNYMAYHCRASPVIRDRYASREKHFVSTLLVPSPTNDSLVFNCCRGNRRDEPTYVHSPVVCQKYNSINRNGNVTTSAIQNNANADVGTESNSVVNVTVLGEDTEKETETLLEVVSDITTTACNVSVKMVAGAREQISDTKTETETTMTAYQEETRAQVQDQRQGRGLKRSLAGVELEEEYKRQQGLATNDVGAPAVMILDTKPKSKTRPTTKPRTAVPKGKGKMSATVENAQGLISAFFPQATTAATTTINDRSADCVQQRPQTSARLCRIRSFISSQ